MNIFKKNERGYSPFTFRFMRSSILRWAEARFKPEMHGLEHMPMTGPCFIFGNHSNDADPFLMTLHMDQEPTAGVMTRFQFYKPLSRYFMDGIGIISTRKYEPDSTVIRGILKLIKQNRMIVIFPEGGRRWDGQPKPLIESTFKLFWKFKVPVHPVITHGSYLSWPRWADYPRKNRMQIHWQKPLHPRDFSNYSEFLKSCREILNIDEYNPPKAALPYEAYKPAAGIQRLLYRCPNTGVLNAISSPDGSTVVSSADSSFNYTMSVTSRLIDQHKQEHSLVDLFARINEMPITYSNANNSVILQDRSALFFKELPGLKLKKLGKYEVTLYNDELRIEQSSDNHHFLLDSIKFLSVESNDHLKFSVDGQTRVLKFKHQSVIPWKQFIVRLQDGESVVTSL